MSRTLTLICYDIADPKRLRAVFELCRSYGDPVQYSIFIARLTAMARAELLAELTSIIHHHLDRVLLIRLGPDTEETMSRFEGLGRQAIPTDDDFSIY